jgi:ATP-dependent helicase HrpB
MKIDDQIAEILELISKNNHVAISSDPGSGKSTRIPPALIQAGYRVLVLEPRRISAISLANHISKTLGTQVGDPIGYQVRGDQKRSKKTKALFATEALLSKYLISDPDLSDWDVVILDEFHERHLHTDIAWALLNQIQKELRPELKVVLLSATLNFEEIERSWPEVKTLHVVNPPYPLATQYIDTSKSSRDPHSLRRLLLQILVDQIKGQKFWGDILIFLPGVFEIRRLHEDLNNALRAVPEAETIKIVELYGSQSLQEQNDALKKVSVQKIVLATNVAESSITIDGVRHVIDTGLEKVTWSNSKSGLSELKIQRISKSAATQRAGRAARQGAGTCLRLWSESEQSGLDEFQVAEIHRSDLSETLFLIYSAGWDAFSSDFQWFEKPHEQRLKDSLTRLMSLNLIDAERKLSSKHQKLSSYPIGLRGAIYLHEIQSIGVKPTHADCQIASLIAAPEGRSVSDLSYLRDTETLAQFLKIPSGSHKQEFTLSDSQVVALTLAAADRAFVRRSQGSANIKLLSGRGATLSPPDQHPNENFGIALLLRESDPDAIVATFVPIDKKHYQKIESSFERLKKEPNKAPSKPNIFSPELDLVQTVIKRAALYKAHVDPSFDLLPTLTSAADSILESNPNFDFEKNQTELLNWAQGMSSPKTWARFELACPSQFELPRSGRLVPLHYTTDTRVELHAKLQEFLGLTTHPRIAENKIRITLVLLSPAMRPIQITQRLEDFWQGSYPEIKKEMKARYPKHEW